MDNLDMRILSRLLDNCRESDRSIGQNLGLSGGAVRARIQKMQEAGVLQRFIVKVEPPLLGFGVLYLVVTGEDTGEILRQAGLIGRPYFVVPCVGGITVCAIVVGEGRGTDGGTGHIQQKIELVRGLMRDVRILAIFEGETPGPAAGMTRTDLEVLGLLAGEPRQRIDVLAQKAGLSAKTVARCRDKLHASPGVQFTVVYDPQKIGRYIPHVVLAWTEGPPADALRQLNARFSESYLQAPFVAKNQVVLFMYSRTIFEMDEITQKVRRTDCISATDLFIPKKILMYDEWLRDAIGCSRRSPRLHLAPSQLPPS